MKRFNHFSVFFFLFFFWISPAMAYIDPASGSVIMSAVIGFFVALGLTIKSYWYKLKSLFFSKKQRIDNYAEKRKK
ncbi:MAG: hypothetical protein A3F12_02940 [Gammaproteobacteria bacterium RIFCSPHIGHO2_12_FULL_38_14]|nr:MAG: hypothetical protein A3F12_02940 [Gammaproteobacteria bacterium RIFCSPHIGHO2_12_FULL_38_14]